jgi:hypothetical protein
MTMLESVNGDQVLEALLLSELNEDEQMVFNCVAALDSGCSLLAYLDANATTLSSSNALALRLGEDAESVQQALKEMYQLGLVRQLDIGPTLWGLTTEPEQRELAHNLVAWQNRWQFRLAKLDRVIHGVACYGA